MSTNETNQEAESGSADCYPSFSEQDVKFLLRCIADAERSANARGNRNYRLEDRFAEIKKKTQALSLNRHGSIVAWAVWAPTSDDPDYYVFTERVDAWDKQMEFDEADPANEHVIEALVMHPTFDYRTHG